MILHELKVGGFRIYADPVTFGPFSERITVIHAPNGTGKTTLLDALYAGLLESHAVSGAKAETAMRSVGRTIVPSVTVEFTSSGRRYKVEKRFLSEPYARLYELVDGAFTLVREGHSVTEFTRNLLHAVPADRGPVRYDKHYGLGAILWSPQGRVVLTPASSALVSTVRVQLDGEQPVDGSDTAVEATLTDWYRTYYTGKSAETSAIGTANLPALRQRVSEAQESLTKATAELATIDALRTELDDAVHDELRWRHTSSQLEEQLGELKIQVAVYEAACAASREATSAYQTANERHATADTAIRTIALARASLTAASRIEVEQRGLLEAARSSEVSANAQLDAAPATVAVASEALAEAHVQSSVANDARTFVVESRILGECDKQILAAETLTKAIEDLRERQASLLAPDADYLKMLRSKYAAAEKLRVQLESSALRVTYIPFSNEAITVSVGHQVTDTSTSPESAIVVSGAPEVEFAIDGAGTVRAEGRTEFSHALREKLRVAGQDCRELTHPFGTDDLSELERRRGEASGIDVRLDTLLRGSDDAMAVDDVKQRRDTARANRARLIASFPEWEQSTPDADALRETASATLMVAQGTHASAAAAYDVARKNVNRVAKAREMATTAHVKAKGDYDSARGTVTALEADGLDDAARAERCRDLGLALLEVKSRVAATKAQLDLFISDPGEEYSNVGTTRAAARDEQHEAGIRAAAARARLEAKCSAGCYDDVARAEARVAETERQLREATQDAAAAKLLFKLFGDAKAEREVQYLQPIRHRTSELYARIANTPVCDVRVNPDLTLEGMMVGSTCIDATLSGGEEEQLNMVTRLALADLLNRGERQLVVLDDSLSVTDSRRFARFLSIVREFSQERMQFLIATCDKARYLSLTEATFIELEAVRRRTDSALLT